MNYTVVKSLLLKAVPVLMLSLLSLLLLFADIHINQQSPRDMQSDMLPGLPQPLDDTTGISADNAVLELFNQFDVVASADDAENTASDKNESMTAEQQQQQQGLMRQLYIGDKVYRLTAIVNQQQYIATLTVTDQNTPDAQPTRQTLQRGDMLAPYQVVAVSARRLTLRHQQRELWLQLFTTEPDLAAVSEQ